MRKAASLAILLAACGGESAITLAKLPQQLHGAICQHEASCGLVLESDCQEESLAWMARAQASTDALQPVIALAIAATEPEVAAELAGKAIEFDGGNARACVDAIGDMDCDTTSQSRRVTPTACFGIFTGTVAAGAACQRDQECVSGSCNRSACEDLTACCASSVCQDLPPSPVAIGDACDFSVCGQGAYCDVATKLCTALVASGAACDQSALECDYGLGCTANACAKLPHVGDACTDLCADENAACVSGKCVALGFQSDACSDTPCSNYYPCDTTAMTPVCTAVPHGGQTCLDQYCADGDYCNVGVGPNGGACASPNADGTTCDAAFECAGGLCVNGSGQGLICATPKVCTGS